MPLFSAGEEGSTITSHKAMRRTRPENSELYKYPVLESRGGTFVDDLALCPRCEDHDIAPGQRVCGRCINEINADDFS